MFGVRRPAGHPYRARNCAQQQPDALCSPSGARKRLGRRIQRRRLAQGRLPARCQGFWVVAGHAGMFSLRAGGGGQEATVPHDQPAGRNQAWTGFRPDVGWPRPLPLPTGRPENCSCAGLPSKAQEDLVTAPDIAIIAFLPAPRTPGRKSHCC